MAKAWLPTLPLWNAEEREEGLARHGPSCHASVSMAQSLACSQPKGTASLHAPSRLPHLHLRCIFRLVSLAPAVRSPQPFPSCPLVHGPSCPLVHGPSCPLVHGPSCPLVHGPSCPLVHGPSCPLVHGPSCPLVHGPAVHWYMAQLSTGTWPQLSTGTWPGLALGIFN